MVSSTARPSVPVVHANEVEHRRLLADRANSAMPKDGSEGMSGPLRLSSYVEASLPDPTLWGGSAVYVSDIPAVAISDGAAWLFLTPTVTPDPPPTVESVLLASDTFSASAQENIDIQPYSTYEQIKLVVSNITQTVDDEYFCRVQFSFDGGSTFKSSAGDYYYTAVENYSADGTDDVFGDNDQASTTAFYSGWIHNDPAYTGNHEMVLHNPYSSTAYKLMSAESHSIGSSSYYALSWKQTGVCWYADPIDKIKIFVNSGTFSGGWTLYGIGD